MKSRGEKPLLVTFRTLLALRIRLPTPYYGQLETLRIEKTIQNSALVHIVWVRPQNDCREA